MILVTGGAGYIGSHTCVSLIESGYQVTILDNLSNSHSEVINRIEKITGVLPNFVKGDIRNTKLLDTLFSEHDYQAVMHFAGFKAVGESVTEPISYYENNVCGTIALLQAMRRAEVTNIVFSSSATVYGDPARVPICEDFPRSATNPYGRSKLMVEDILMDLYTSDAHWNAAILRYFNPVGAHASGLIGEDPLGIPNNLMPYIAQVAIGRREKLSIYGNDYPTPDGTGIRDYIHVVDLAEGHVAALRYLEKVTGLLAVNLGTGIGYSVLEMVNQFEDACNCHIPYEITGRRSGDIARCFADPHMAEKLLGWKAQHTLHDMCKDTWNWQSKNPSGYK